MHAETDQEKEQKVKDWEWYFAQLRGNECLCGREKLPRKSFCGRCYHALPGDLKPRLYLRLGGGYEEAFEEAHRWLEENLW